LTIIGSVALVFTLSMKFGAKPLGIALGNYFRQQSAKALLRSGLPDSSEVTFRHVYGCTGPIYECFMLQQRDSLVTVLEIGPAHPRSHVTEVIGEGTVPPSSYACFLNNLVDFGFFAMASFYKSSSWRSTADGPTTITVRCFRRGDSVTHQVGMDERGIPDGVAAVRELVRIMRYWVGSSGSRKSVTLTELPEPSRPSDSFR